MLNARSILLLHYKRRISARHVYDRAGWLAGWPMAPSSSDLRVTLSSLADLSALAFIFIRSSNDERAGGA